MHANRKGELHMEAKKIAAEQAVEAVRDHMIVGLGTGSTAYWAILKLGAMVKEGLQIKAIATSVQSETLAVELGIPLISPAEIEEIDLTIDGADELDHSLNLIKGGGGALLREKIIASASKELIIVADESKRVRQLGTFPLPVEVVRFGYELTLKQIRLLGCSARLRMNGDEVFVTDNDNYIADCSFGEILDPRMLQRQLTGIPGVVETGLFIGMAKKAVIGSADGTVRKFTV